MKKKLQEHECEFTLLSKMSSLLVIKLKHCSTLSSVICLNAVIMPQTTVSALGETPGINL